MVIIFSICFWRFEDGLLLPALILFLNYYSWRFFILDLFKMILLGFARFCLADGFFTQTQNAVNHYRNGYYRRNSGIPSRSSDNSFSKYLTSPITGGSKFYHKKYVKEDWFMWWPMQKTQILPHIRSMNFRSKFIEISDRVSKPKFYYIENQILPKFFGSKSNNDSFCGKI